MTNFSFNQNRRKFLSGSSVLSVAACLPKIFYAQASVRQNGYSNPAFAQAPRDASLKFYPDGSPKPFAGNTVICHLPQQCRFRDETAALGDALRSSSFAHKCGILPSNSYHMSVFTGANDQDRALYGWPADVPITAPIAECNRTIGERISNFRMGGTLPIKVKVDRDRTLSPQRVSSLRMSPANESEEAKLRDLRNRLAAEVFRFRAGDHDSYALHISLAYQLRELTPEEEREHHAVLEHHVPLITSAAPILELGVPEFCTFENMYRFEIRSLLRT